MSTHNRQPSTVSRHPLSGVFITFSGNCKEALTFYQNCFGGSLQFEIFDKELEGYSNLPVISGSLVSDPIIIHGSDLVHNEGRKVGNNISIYLKFKNASERRALINKLACHHGDQSPTSVKEENLIELSDPFGVRWVLGL